MGTATRVLTVSSGGAVTPMFRRNAAGQIVEVMPEQDEYQTPAKGSRARVELSGISDTFEMTTQFSDTPVTKVRVEYRIVKGANNTGKLAEGKRFTEIHTWTIGPKSNLGRLIGALRGAAVAPGEAINPDDFIGTTFVTTISTTDDGKWGKVSPDAIEAGSVKFPAGSALAGESAPAPAAPPAVAAAADEDDPFEVDEEI